MIRSAGIATRSTATAVVRRKASSPSASRRMIVSQASRSHGSNQAGSKVNKNVFPATVGTILVASAALASFDVEPDGIVATSLLRHQPPQCSAKVGGEVVMIGPTKEPATGILFPRLCNALTFVGCGVRIKYRFIKVYAVGTYVDPIAMDYLKKRGNDEIEKALLDPQFPRTIRVVMNRSLSIAKYTAAIVEALEPRMNGEDLDKLEEFKKLNPPGDLVEGAVMEMTIRGDTLLYKNSAGSVGAIHSDVFCRALCDVYYGSDAVSQPHKEDVINGIKAL